MTSHKAVLIINSMKTEISKEGVIFNFVEVSVYSN